jgi:hypothetical protein
MGPLVTPIHRLDSFSIHLILLQHFLAEVLDFHIPSHCLCGVYETKLYEKKIKKKIFNMRKKKKLNFGRFWEKVWKRVSF